MNRHILIVLLGCMITTLAAETESAASDAGAKLYVTDHIVILLRAGPSNKHKILKSIGSGTPLDALDTEGEYTKVRSDGKEGWVLSRHLSKQPIAKQRLTQVQNKLDALKKQHEETKQQLEQVQQENETLKKNLEGWSQEKAQMSEELERVKDVAAKPLELSSANKDLAMQAVSMENKVELMKQEIQVLRNDSDKQWFMTGAGVVMLGIIIGMIIPKFRRHRRSDWSSLS